jgi:hypothetical protein
MEVSVDSQRLRSSERVTTAAVNTVAGDGLDGILRCSYYGGLIGLTLNNNGIDTDRGTSGHCAIAERGDLRLGQTIGP